MRTAPPSLSSLGEMTMERKTGKFKRIFLPVVILLVIWVILDICITEINTKKIPHSYASVDEGRKLLLANTEYYEQYSQNDIDFRLRKSGATLDELLNVSADSVKKFNFFEKFYIDHRISGMYKALKKNNYTLPEIDEIVFIKMDMGLEGGASGYTHGTEIYLNSVNVTIYSLMNFLPEFNRSMDELLWHELFHCLTRCNPDFRSEMYSLIHFSVADSDYELPLCIREKVLSNPDVEHHDSYATFLIDGKEIDCYVAWITTKSYAEAQSGWSSCEAVALVPIDGTDTFYLSEQASNFDEIFGTNTYYVIDPEECMADNFADAMLYGIEGKDGQGFPNPEIIQGIIDIMRR